MFEHGFLPLITDHLFGYNTPPPPPPPKMIWHLQTIKVTYPWVCDLNHTSVATREYFPLQHQASGGLGLKSHSVICQKGLCYFS